MGVYMIFPGCIGLEAISHFHSCTPEIERYGEKIAESEMIPRPAEMGESVMITEINLIVCLSITGGEEATGYRHTGIVGYQYRESSDAGMPRDTDRKADISVCSGRYRVIAVAWEPEHTSLNPGGSTRSKLQSVWEAFSPCHTPMKVDIKVEHKCCMGRILHSALCSSRHRCRRKSPCMSEEKDMC